MKGPSRLALFLPGFWAVALKEIQQLSRDRITLGMIVGIPLLQILLFGYAINLDVRHLDGAVLDLSGSAQGRAVIADTLQSQVLDLSRTVEDTAELEQALRRGEVSIGIYLPPDFGERLEDPDRAAAQLWVDGSDPQILASAGQLTAMPAPGAEKPEAPLFESRPFYNPERRTAMFIVPGLLGVVLTMTMIMFTSMAIVRERERGNLEFLSTTPLPPSALMLGKIAPYVLIGLLQFSIILATGYLLFEVPLRGSLAELYLAALVFIAASLSLGLIISTKAVSQFQAMQMTFFVFLPSILLSGFMFPFQGMPRLIQWVAEILPLTHFLRIVRGILIRGASLSELQLELWILLAFFLVVVGISALRFKKNLD